jgi:putative endonuclease
VRVSRTELGQRWEAKACEHLCRHGLEVLKRRYRCRLGELDLVCRDGDAIVVVEVRARAANAFVAAVESIDRRKRLRIIRATAHLLMCHPQWQRRPVRFDIVAFDGIDTGAPRLSWLKGAFEG